MKFFPAKGARLTKLSCVNVGCGLSPTPGWINIDNSWSVRLAEWPVIMRLGSSVGLLSQSNRSFAAAARELGVKHADVRKPLPFADNSLDVVYSSHMIEHLDREVSRFFIAEAARVLRPGGVLRLAVPDLRKHVEDYVSTGDGNRLVEALNMSREEPVSLIMRLRARLTPFRGHRWMYDEASLRELVDGCGFTKSVVLDAGQTTISSPGDLNLSERLEESLYIEATKDGRAA